MARFDSGLPAHLDGSTVDEAPSFDRRPPADVPGLTILWHADPARIGHWVPLAALGSGREVALSRLEPRFVDPDGGRPMPLADPHVSRRPIRLVPGDDGSLRVLDGGSKLVCRPAGRAVAEGVELDAGEVADGVVLELADRVALLLHPMPATRPRPPRFGLVGDSGAVLRLRQDVDKVADLDVPVLLRGETGTGKELVARAIHGASRRREAGFLAVNVGAIPPTLAAAELFGAVRGAFTGAERKRDGTFVQADGGTLLLDEIGECPPDVQVLLLRTLESGEIQPVGAERPRRVDVRLVAATDADLEGAIDDGRFRAPLLHRLDGFTLHLPPLRRRRDDVGRLLVHFLRRELDVLGEAHKLGAAGPREPLWLPASLVGRMATCRWPGNVRQLRNLARHLVIAQRGAPRVVIDERLEALLAEADASPGSASPGGASHGGASHGDAGPAERTDDRIDGRTSRRTYRPPSEVTEAELRQALEAHDWQLKATAAALGVSRTSLYGLIERHPHLRTAARLDRAEVAAALERHEGDLEAAADELRVSAPALQRRAAELGLA